MPRSVLRSILVAILVIAGAAPALAAGDVCRTARMANAEREANRMISVMVENAPIECKILVESKSSSKCSFLCVSIYDMSEGQRRSALVYLASIAGMQANTIGVSRFGTITYIDRGMAKSGYGMRIAANDAARLQKQIKSEQISATQFLNSVLAAYSRVSTKR